jgi:sterol desaturase/sphingolipid hydroxylase (fatty acid hydroxylase superfamily)
LLNKGWLMDLVHTYEPYVRAFVIGGAASALAPHVASLPGAGFMQGQSLWLHLVALVLVSEVSFYFIHRWMHASPILWEFHRVHHSPTVFYSLITSRLHIVDMLVFSLPYILVVGYIGAAPSALFAYATFQGFMDRYGHSNIDGVRFGKVLGRVFSGPHFHAWHHCVDKEARGRNYSRDFTFMDYLFRTAFDPPGRRATTFGDPSFTTNYLVQQARPFWRVARSIGMSWRMGRR